MGIICRWDSIEESCYLRPQITDHNKLFQNILRQNVGVSSFFDVIWTDINMICSQMQIGGRNGTHSPFRFGGKSIGFVVACSTKNRKNIDYFLLKFSFLPIFKANSALETWLQQLEHPHQNLKYIHHKRWKNKAKKDWIKSLDFHHWQRLVNKWTFSLSSIFQI